MAVTSVGAGGGPSLPPGLKSLKPHQVVEQGAAHREVLYLSQEQCDLLEAISVALRAEKLRFTHRGGKSHRTRYVPLTSRGQAFEQTLAVLTEEPRQRVKAFSQAPLSRARAERKPLRPHGKP